MSHAETSTPMNHDPQPRRTGDFIFTFSYESLSDAQKRGMMRPPDRLVASLINSPDVRRLLVVDPFRPWATAWGRNLVDYRHRPIETEKLRHSAPLRWARKDPTDPSEIETVYREYEAHARKASESAGLQTPAFITASPLVAGFAELDWTGPALYYARDDWLSSPGRRKYWPAYREAYQRMAASGRAVAAVSQEIIDRIGPTGPHAVVPNGIEPREWLGDQPEAPDWFAKIPGPRAVYLGTLDSRLDIEGLRVLASARPDLNIVLIGPVPHRPFLERIGGVPNVHIRGEVRRREVVAVLRNAELTLLAHRQTALTEAMSPLKVYEYLAAGRPVLATDLRPVRGFGDRVHLAPTVAEFVDLVDGALAQGVQDEDERRAYIAANAWATRHQQIMALLGE